MASTTGEGPFLLWITNLKLFGGSLREDGDDVNGMEKKTK